eukprot:gene6130-2735_t
MAFKGPATFKGHAVVVGAGPAGCLSAMHLAKRGYRVDVFEKRSKEMLDPTVEKNGTRTYKMSLNSRSIHALENVGAKIPSFGPEAVPNMGAWMGGRPPTMGVSIIGDPYSAAYSVPPYPSPPRFRWAPPYNGRGRPPTMGVSIIGDPYSAAYSVPPYPTNPQVFAFTSGGRPPTMGVSIIGDPYSAAYSVPPYPSPPRFRWAPPYSGLQIGPRAIKSTTQYYSSI